MSIPIILVHKGNDDYLYYTLKQAKFFNSKSKIFLLGDESNKKRFINHFYIRDYFDSAEKFSKIYKHLSFSDYNYELFCFQRWFIIKDFIIRNNINDFFYIDSDVLLYQNLSTLFNNFNYELTICNKYGAMSSYFKNSKSLINLCDYIENLYTDKENLKMLENIFDDYKKENKFGGICDMTAFFLYSLKYPELVYDYGIITEKSESIFDNNINEPQGFEFDNHNKIKKIMWKGKIPYGYYKELNKLIRFNSLHFQGGAKKYIPEYYQGDDKLFIEFKKQIFNFIFLIKNKIKRKINDILKINKSG